jgi:hypothetical protein
MAKYHRKSSRRHRSKKSHKRHSRRRHTRRRQQGGGSCAAMPLNREMFAQRGGMAPYQAGGTDYLLDASTRVQAEVGPLDQSFAELPVVLKAAGVVPNQLGGARRRGRLHPQRRGGSRKSHKRHSRKRHSRRQRGGMAPFDAPYEMYKGGVPLIPVPQRGGSAQSAVPAPFDEVSRPSLLPAGSLYGQNPQFVTEAGVNSLYRYEGGAQTA